MTSDELRSQLIKLVDGRGAHMAFEDAVAAFPDGAMNSEAPNVPYTPWHILEHLRRTQRDILDYIRDRAYVSPNWPEDYWPARDARATRGQFDATIAEFLADRQILHVLVEDPATDVAAIIPGSPGHSILREIRLVADHNAYHIGEFAILRQVMGTWPPGRNA
jgi:hypothetical protein